MVMNWTRIVLDGIAMALVFNAVVGMFWFIMPHAYTRMLPKEIKEAAGPCTKQELTKLVLVIYPLYIGVIAWIVLSTHDSGTVGFWPLFWTGYIEMLFVNFGDFLILDCWLRSIVRVNCTLPGTENCEAWQFKQWMKSAVPEHFIAWPLIFCTLVGLICAGVCTLIG